MPTWIGTPLREPLFSWDVWNHIDNTLLRPDGTRWIDHPKVTNSIEAHHRTINSTARREGTSFWTILGVYQTEFSRSNRLSSLILNVVSASGIVSVAKYHEFTSQAQRRRAVSADTRMAEALKSAMTEFDPVNAGRSLTRLARASRGVRPPVTPILPEDVEATQPTQQQGAPVGGQRGGRRGRGRSLPTRSARI